MFKLQGTSALALPDSRVSMCVLSENLCRRPLDPLRVGPVPGHTHDQQMQPQVHTHTHLRMHLHWHWQALGSKYQTSTSSFVSASARPRASAGVVRGGTVVCHQLSRHNVARRQSGIWIILLAHGRRLSRRISSALRSGPATRTPGRRESGTDVASTYVHGAGTQYGRGQVTACTCSLHRHGRVHLRSLFCR